MEPGNLIPSGIWTLADVLQYGRDKGVCPYFAIRRMVTYTFLLHLCIQKLPDALRGCNHLLLPLPPGSESR